MAKKRVLVVDDNMEFLDEFKETLELSGYEPIAISDSLSALDIAQKTMPDIIILDIKMDGLNGYQIADRLGKINETANIPIVAMTGCFINDAHLKLMNILGIKALIRKPFNPLDVISKIEMIEKNRANNN